MPPRAARPLTTVVKPCADGLVFKVSGKMVSGLALEAETLDGVILK